MSTRNYEQLLEFLYRVPVGLVEIDGRGEIRLMNAYASQVLMPVSGPSWTQNLFDILDAHAPELPSSIAQHESAFGTVISNERIKLLDDWYALTVERLDEDSYMVAFRNVTDEVEREQRLQSAITQEAEQRGRMEIAGSVLHDIGNALGGLSTKVARLLAESRWREVTELERLQVLVEDQREPLARALGAERQAALSTFLAELVASLEGRSDEIRGTAEEMAQTLEHVSETLSLQRQYAQEWTTGSRAPVHLMRLIEDAIAMQRSGFEKRGVTLSRSYPDGTVLVAGDRTKLVRVFVNLVKNALESFDELERSQADPPLIHISVECVDTPEGRRARVSVKDNAVGFDVAPRSLTEEERSTDKAGGSGMGLYAARHIVDAHEGELSLESDGAGQGATATVMLPVARELKTGDGS
ncbi:MAG: HAMP domain-containing sensor histidine kinase [Spirochaetia bacterium]